MPTLPSVIKETSGFNKLIVSAVSAPKPVTCAKFDVITTFVKKRPSPVKCEAETLPRTVNTFVAISSIYKFEPTSRVWIGAIFAIPAFCNVTNATSGLLNSIVSTVTLLTKDISLLL